MSRPIAISLSPNAQKQDVFVALKALPQRAQMQKGSSITKLEDWFSEYFSTTYNVSFYSGRACLYILLKAMGVANGDEVLLQTFTCVAVPNAIVWTGAKPVYVDINKELTIDVDDLEKKITKKTKVIVVQHTFGIPSEMEKIMAIAKKHKLFVIEDCAHGVGQEYKGKKLGTIGDAAFFSFGRDKAFSSVFGGMAITNNKKIGEHLKQFQKQADFPPLSWIKQQLLHPVLFSLVLPTYNNLQIGKILLVLFQKIRLLSFPVSQQEKAAERQELRTWRMPNALCALALLQLSRIETFNATRISFGREYMKQLENIRVKICCDKPIAFLRFPILVENRDDFLAFCKRQGVYLGKWYSEVIDPKGTNLSAVFYEMGSCLQAEKTAQQIINLPTYPTLKEKDISRIVSLLKTYYGTR